VGVLGVSTPADKLLRLRPFGNYICDANPTFWCILGSENEQLLTGVKPEGAAGGEGWGFDAPGRQRQSRPPILVPIESPYGTFISE